MEVSNYTGADIPMLCKVHLKAFKGYMNASMGGAYVRAFLSWFEEEPETVTLKASYNSETCGYVLGAPIGYTGKMNKDLMNQVLMSVASHPVIFFHPKFVKTAFGRAVSLFQKNKPTSVLRPSLFKGI